MLRGPKFHHKDLAKAATKAAIGRYKNVVFLAQEGQCIRALIEYGTAANEAGRQRAHAREVWSGAVMIPTMVSNEESKARRTLVRACFSPAAQY